MTRAQETMSNVTTGMRWEHIESAPTDCREILVGFWGGFRWVSYVALAEGNLTGQNMQFALPTHWTPIIPPELPEFTS